MRQTHAEDSRGRRQSIVLAACDRDRAAVEAGQRALLEAGYVDLVRLRGGTAHRAEFRQVGDEDAAAAGGERGMVLLADEGFRLQLIILADDMVERLAARQPCAIGEEQAARAVPG